jgi:YD repeat-containing protein
MKNLRCHTVCVWIAVLGLFACKKSSGSAEPSCQLTGETMTFGTTKEVWRYEYDAKGNPKECKWMDTTGLVVGDVVVSANRVVNWSWYTRTTDTTDYTGDIFGGIPTQSKITELWDGHAPTDQGTYTFGYDGKGQVTDVTGSFSYSIHITYDDAGNVTQMLYKYTQGSTSVTVTDYDNKPSPYHSSGKSWKFLQHHANWNNADDPQPLIAVLSKNNPLKISLVQGNPAASYLTGTEVIVISYNDHDLPDESSVTFVHPGSAPRLVAKYAFSYDCK